MLTITSSLKLKEIKSDDVNTQKLLQVDNIGRVSTIDIPKNKCWRSSGYSSAMVGGHGNQY